jgi:hypothetical protein
MLSYSTRCNIALGIMSIFTLTSCEDCNNDAPNVKPVYASWQIGNNIWEANNPCTYNNNNGFLESDCNDNHKMFIGVNGVLDKTPRRLAVLTYGTTPIPANAITIDITDDVGVDYLSAGSDSADLIKQGDGSAYIHFTNVHIIKATSSGPGVDTTTFNGQLTLP